MDKFTLRELQAIAKERNIKGCTKYRKSKLAQMLGFDLIEGNKKQKTGEASAPPKIPLLSKGERKQNRRGTWKPRLSKVITRSTSKSKKQPDWLDLPSDVMLNILSRIGVAEILWNVQVVCTYWHEICKDPCMWRVVYMDRDVYSNHEPYAWPSWLPDSALSFKGARQICEMIVERSQGQLVDITIVECCDDELLQYVVDRSSQLRRLSIAYSYETISDEGFTEALKKLPLLEELSIYNTSFSHKNIEALGSYCRLLKRLKLSYTEKTRRRGFPKVIVRDRELPKVIVQNLPQLTHLELNWLSLSDSGLKALLDGCRHLQLLDLRMCEPISLEGELRKRCLGQIKCVKLPTDPIKCLPYSDSDDYVEHVTSFEPVLYVKIFRCGISRLWEGLRSEDRVSLESD